MVDPKEREWQVNHRTHLRRYLLSRGRPHPVSQPPGTRKAHPPLLIRPPRSVRSEHAAGSQARARPPAASPAITSETPPANPYERPGRRIVVNESANTTYSPEQKAWDGWDSDLDRGSDEDQEGAYRKALQENLHRSEEYEMESAMNTLEDALRELKPWSLDGMGKQRTTQMSGFLPSTPLPRLWVIGWLRSVRRTRAWDHPRRRCRRQSIGNLSRKS